MNAQLTKTGEKYAGSVLGDLDWLWRALSKSDLFLYLTLKFWITSGYPVLLRVTLYMRLD